MKTYILDTVERVKRYSQSLDVKTILCSKAWYVLNEDGDTENLIFQPDGSVLVSVNGSTKKYTWQYIPQNQSLNIMHSEVEGTMLKPAFIDGTILAFNKIGTKECMFLIDDSLDESKKIYSLESVKKYLLAVEGEAIKKAKAIEDRKKAAELARIVKSIEEKKREEARKKAAELAKIAKAIEDKKRIEARKLEEELLRKKMIEEKQQVIEQFESRERRLKDKYDYEDTLKWYNICKCNTVSYAPFSSISFWLIWLGLSGVILALGLYFGIVNNIDDGALISLSFLPLPIFPISYFLSILFEKWLAYKKRKIFYDEYVQNTGESLEKFSYRIFYDIKNDYEEFEKKMSELNNEKVSALKKYKI